MKTKKYDIGTVLSISHGRLLTDIGNVYEILNFMLDDNLFTHQLPRAGDFCKPIVLKQHPHLKQWDELNEKITTENWKEYLQKAKEIFGETLEISKVENGWKHKNPISEAVEMMGEDKVLIITPESKP